MMYGFQDTAPVALTSFGGEVELLEDHATSSDCGVARKSQNVLLTADCQEAIVRLASLETLQMKLSFGKGAAKLCCDARLHADICRLIVVLDRAHGAF
jgi:hypothetical protein